MWPPKRIDIDWSDIAFALSSFLGRMPATGSLDAAGQLACLSVRSGFDLLLSAASFPAGDEVLMSALTIPDMPRIVAHHGLVPVPVDLDIETLAPRLDLLEAAVTPRTRAIVVAHLFGSRVPMQPIVEIASRHGLLVIEDVAQSWRGQRDHGHPQSGAALFSFGPIKTATALGGAIIEVRDPQLLRRMRDLHEQWPRQSALQSLKRLGKYAAIKALTARPPYTAIVNLARLAGCDYDAAFANFVRGFAGNGFFERLRQRPSMPLLKLLDHRMRAYQAERLARRVALAYRLADQLEADYELPGSAARDHSHWVFPVLTAEPAAMIHTLAAARFHATQGRSLAVVDPPADRPELEPSAARRLLREAVFLPLYPDLPTREVDRLAQVLLKSPLRGSPRAQPKAEALLADF